MNIWRQATGESAALTCTPGLRQRRRPFDLAWCCSATRSADLANLQNLQRILQSWESKRTNKENTSRCFTTRISIHMYSPSFQHQLMSEQNSEVPCAWCCQQNCCCSCSNAASFIQVASCQDWFGDWLDTRTAVFASPWFQVSLWQKATVCNAQQKTHWGYCML